MNGKDALRLVRKNLRRRPLRAFLTMFGVAFVVMLLVGIESFSEGMSLSLRAGDKAKTLVVYRQNRYCPQTSYLPERYVEEIESIDGVESVLPVKVFLNNCRTNLDMITFHGSPVSTMLEARNLELLEGDLEQFRSEADAALVGTRFAQRRGLRVGDKFRFGDITVKVSGIFGSADPVQEGLILTHLEFLQRAGPVDRLGTVTQFDVRIEDPERAETIADEIDRRFETSEEPTETRLMAAFLERATSDLQEILRFARWFGLACVFVMVLLVANTISMSVMERTREFGIFRAIGFRAPHLAAIVLLESGAMAIIGGVFGCVAMGTVLMFSNVSIGVEGVQVPFFLSMKVFAISLALSGGSALVAGLIPALQVARLDVIRALRGSG